jgi:hypothetical protein
MTSHPAAWASCRFRGVHSRKPRVPSPSGTQREGQGEGPASDSGDSIEIYGSSAVFMGEEERFSRQDAKGAKEWIVVFLKPINGTGHALFHERLARIQQVPQPLVGKAASR